MARGHGSSCLLPCWDLWALDVPLHMFLYFPYLQWQTRDSFLKKRQLFVKKKKEVRSYVSLPLLRLQISSNLEISSSKPFLPRLAFREMTGQEMISFSHLGRNGSKWNRLQELVEKLSLLSTKSLTLTLGCEHWRTVTDQWNRFRAWAPQGLSSVGTQRPIRGYHIQDVACPKFIPQIF